MNDPIGEIARQAKAIADLQQQILHANTVVANWGTLRRKQDEIIEKHTTQLAEIRVVNNQHTFRNAVYSAVLSALLAKHPDPDEIRRQADFLLAQMQSTMATTHGPGKIGPIVGAILAEIFKTTTVPPEGERE